jgi:tetratricopeptide (TPR) repeat protein
MTDTPFALFISYGRQESCFVDKLEADLQVRRYPTQVDRRSIEFNQPWKQILRDAIDRSSVVLIILTPTAVSSRLVQMEYRYALSQQKPIIALEYQACPFIPEDLKIEQCIVFAANKTDYEQRVKQLLIALEYPDGKQPQDAETLYREGAEAKARGEPELAVALWQQVLEREPGFRDNTLASQVESLSRDLVAEHSKNLRVYAQQAQQAGKLRKASGFWQALLELDKQDKEARETLERNLRSLGMNFSKNGEWEQAMSAWETLLQLKPEDAQVDRQFRLALHNQQYAEYYEDALQYIKEDESTAARIQLHQLWRYAPYYGDPAGLALKADLTEPEHSPATFGEQLSYQ